MVKKVSSKGSADEQEVNLDDEVNLEEENLDDNEDGENQENLDIEPKQKKGTDTDEEGEAEENEGINNEDAGNSEEDGGVDPRDERIAKLEEELNSIKENFKKSVEEKAPQARVYTEEEKASIEQESGMEFRQVQYVERMMKNVVGAIKNYVEGQLGGSKKTVAIQKLSRNPDFADIGKYTDGIDEFLADYRPETHSNEKLLEKAYFYAKGKGTKKEIKQIISNRDKNKKIVGKSRPVGGNSGKQRQSTKLTEEESRAARAAGMSEEEYAEFKKPLHQIRGK